MQSAVDSLNPSPDAPPKPDRVELELTAAIRALRREYRESQQAFANRLQTAIRTVAHYESDRPPTGRALDRFFEMALEKGRYDLGATFQRVRFAELGIRLPPEPDPDAPIETDDPNSRRAIEAVRRIRAALGDSLVAFALRINCGAEFILHFYKTGGGEAIIQAAVLDLARKLHAEHPEIAEIARGAWGYGRFDVRTEEAFNAAGALLFALRHNATEAERATARRALKELSPTIEAFKLWLESSSSIPASSTDPGKDWVFIAGVHHPVLPLAESKDKSLKGSAMKHTVTGPRRPKRTRE